MKAPTVRRSLSVRLLWLTAGVVLLAELFILHQFVRWSPLNQGALLGHALDERALNEALRSFTWKLAAASLLMAGLAGVLVYLTLLALLVRPMRRIIESVAAFRADPARGAPLDAQAVNMLADDEMAVAGREIAAMQSEMRAKLWRSARLAAVGGAVAKVSHDLRNILSSALLAADRLIAHPDPQIAQSGELLVRTVEQATEMLRQTLEFAREGPPPLTRTVFGVRELVDEAVAGIAAVGAVCAARNDVAPELTVEADRSQFYRVLLNLLRNAAEAGAHSVRIAAEADAGCIAILVEDDGPGLPDIVQANLFRPFVTSRRGGTGLGLAIARDLMRAHGGDIELVGTGPAGTLFRLILPPAQAARAPGADADQALEMPVATSLPS